MSIIFFSIWMCYVLGYYDIVNTLPVQYFVGNHPLIYEFGDILKVNN